MNTRRLIPLVELRDGVPHRCRMKQSTLLLCRVGSEVYAVDDQCPHEDVSLSLGCLDGHHIRCPLHGSEFDVRSGEVLCEPAEQNLKTWPVSVVDNWVVLDGD